MLNKQLRDPQKSKERSRFVLDETVKFLGGEKGWITYFPVEEGYGASMWNERGSYECLTSELHPTIESCLKAALEYLLDKK